MNMWHAGALLLAVGLIPCGVAVVRGSFIVRLPALQMAGVLTSFIILLLAEAYGQPSFCDLALALALLSFPGTLLFLRFLGRWL